MRPKRTDAAAAFTAQLGQRHPDWLPFLTVGTSPADGGGGPAIHLEVPSPGDGPTLWLQLRSGQATVGLGERAAERMFVWEDPDEREEAFEEIFHFLGDLRTAEVLMVWTQHRFLWKRWETASFVRAADVPGDPAIVRVEAWPAPTPDAS